MIFLIILVLTISCNSKKLIKIFTSKVPFLFFFLIVRKTLGKVEGVRSDSGLRWELLRVLSWLDYCYWILVLWGVK